MLEIMPNLNSTKKEPLYLQLYEYLRKEIQKGNIPPHSKLPSQRNLANHLSLSRNTINTAYQQLVTEGYVRNEERKGLFVEEIKNEMLLTEPYSPGIRETTNNELNAYEGKSIKMKYDFKYGDIDLTHFPFKLWRQLTLKSLAHEQDHLLLYGHPQGELELRKYIARYLYQSRGVECSENQIIIGAGTQYLLSMLCKIVGRELVYGIEEPGYNRVRFIFKEYGQVVKPIPLDQNGINVTHLKDSKVKVVYVTPSHQFPLGMVMPVSRRLELIEWAKETGGYIIEDDYDSEFRYEGKPIPSLQSLDSNGKVIYMGTFAKSLIPSLRLSYMVLPSKLLIEYNKHFIGYAQTVSRLHQHTLKLFIETGQWSRHLNKVRNIYKKKHNALLTAIRAHMDGKVKVMGSGAGLHVLLEPKNNMTERELIDKAREQGVLVYPVSTFYDQRSHQEYPQILLGFAGLDENGINEGVQLLSKAWF
ncbi:PLP-dependent aminotransferase family protein [Priestia filamentosa]|uniref:MocR-like pyridoxine biosynthesis transcription factor PdxR n=1 Tax=Priestia filamentosa TaxID=1402861 RepID=UPI001FB2D988|nr:PLP-dependent aminotransferase family protein [Priestia filamentosa]UOE58529.1 PLP-dependent aminotransferase family protein [Priestia filamentosa]